MSGLEKFKKVVLRLWLLVLIAFFGFQLSTLPSLYQQIEYDASSAADKAIRAQLDSLYIQKHDVDYKAWQAEKRQLQLAQCTDDYLNSHPLQQNQANHMARFMHEGEQRRLKDQASAFCLANTNLEPFDAKIILSTKDRWFIKTSKIIPIWIAGIFLILSQIILVFILFAIASFIILRIIPVWLIFGELSFDKGLLKNPIKSMKIP